MIFVSFYTRNYLDSANRLRASLDRWGIEHDITEKPCSGSWQKNTHYKAEVCYEALKKHQRFCWIDADSELMADPRYELERLPDFDMAAHIFRGYQLNAALLMFRRSKSVESLMLRWRSSLDRGFIGHDQDCLAVELYRTQDIAFRFHSLGPEWCYVDDLSRRFYPMPERILVYQHQESRRRHRWEKISPNLGLD